MKKTLLIVFAVLMNVSVIHVQGASAAQCFEQFPDSSWSKGEPNSVLVMLNRDLVRTKKLVTRNIDGKELRNSIPTYGIDDIIPKYLNNTQIDYIWKKDFKQITYPVTVTYEYQGSNCGTRTIIISSGSITYKPYNSIEISDTNSIQDALKAYSKDDFITIQKKVDQITLLSNYLESTKSSPIKISSHNITDDTSFAWWLGLNKYTNPFLNGYPFLEVLSEDNCLTNDNSKISNNILDMINKMSVVEKSFYQRSLYGFFDKISFTQGSKVCKLTVSFPIESNLMIQKNIDFVRVNGNVWVENNLPAVSPTKSPFVQPLKVIISCIKGKVIKQVTGVNPKCPSGYKLKK